MHNSILDDYLHLETPMWCLSKTVAKPSCAWLEQLRCREGGTGGNRRRFPPEDGAVERTRTSTGLLPHAPQACASTNFATTARKRKRSGFRLRKPRAKGYYQDSRGAQSSISRYLPLHLAKMPVESNLPSCCLRHSSPCSRVPLRPCRASSMRLWSAMAEEFVA